MHAALMALATAIVLSGPQQRPIMSSSGNTLTVPGCLVTLIEDVPVPALEAGQLTELKVREGDLVKTGQLLAQIDDSLVRRAEEVTRNEFEAAKAEAGNNVDVRYAKASRSVAEADYQKSQETNTRVPNTVTAMELRRLWLELQKSTLGIEQAEHNQELAHFKANVAEAKHNASLLDIERRQVKSPKDGLIVKRFVREGAWLKPGDPVVRLLRLDKLWVEGFVDATGPNGVMAADVDGRPVTVRASLARNQEVVLRGKIVFVSPEQEASAQFAVKAEVINEKRDGYWVLRPGSNADMTIELGR